MGFRDWFRRAPAQPIEPQLAEKAVSLELLDRLDGWTVGRETSAGVVVSELTALQVATVLACVTRVALDVATMPLEVRLRQQDGSSIPLERSRAWYLLRRRPNPVHSAHELFGMMTAQGMLYGDAFAYVTRLSDGRPGEIWPLARREVSVTRTGFVPTYTVNAYEGAISGTFSRSNIMHVRQITLDGLRGIDRVLMGAQAIGLARAAQTTQAKSFANGNRMPGYWSTENSLEQTALERLAASLRAATTGESQWRSPLLDRGLKYTAVGQNFDEAQLIETRKHEMLEVCAAFNVLPAVLGIDDKTQAFASVEAMFAAHIRQTLRPWLKAWEQAIDRDLLDDSGPMYARFDTSDMEKATTKERAESYGQLGQSLVMMPNEMREREGLRPIPGLDELWIEMQRGKSGMNKAPAAAGSQETPAATGTQQE